MAASEHLCVVPGCVRGREESQRCAAHARTWRNHAVRCHCCSTLIEQPGSYRDFKDLTQTPKIFGRSDLWKLGEEFFLSVPHRVSLCSQHEHLHLMRHYRQNLALLADGLGVDESYPSCWTWKGDTKESKGGRSRPMFLPHEGSTESKWIAYRVAWEMTGQEPLRRGHQLDHRGCRNGMGSNDRNTLCCNPLHLQPVTPGRNQKSKKKRLAPPSRKRATDGALYLAQRAGLPWPFPVTQDERISAAEYPRELESRYGSLRFLPDMEKLHALSETS